VIKTFDYLKTFPEIEDEVMGAITRVLHSNYLILGPETDAFEDEFAKFMGAKHCIAVSSGTTALHLALLGLGIGQGDEVITVSNTCAPTISAIRLAGSTPVFIDIRDDDLMMNTALIESHLTDKTRCILPVHLWGMSVDMDEVVSIASKYSLEVIEDCAQAQGTSYNKRYVGTFSNVGCFSFYPTKNLGAYGDAGAIITNDDDLAEHIRKKRMYGYNKKGIAVEEGMNARIAEIQAAILRIKLRIFKDWLDRRLHVAQIYNKGIDNPLITKPVSSSKCSPSYHQYIIRCSKRDKLAGHLKSNHIGYGIHYPTPVHLMPAYHFLGNRALNLPVTEKACSEILSLPIHEGITRYEAEKCVEVLNNFQF
jgi:aminotransferase EvaB